MSSENFNWFEKDLRAGLWVFETVSKFSIFTTYNFESLIFDIDFYPPFIPNQKYANIFQIIYIFKHADFDFSEKTQKLQLLKRIYKKNMMSFKEIKWLDKHNEEQIYWAEEYLKKRFLMIDPLFFIADSIEEKYQQILATLDFLAISQNINLYRLFVEVIPVTKSLQDLEEMNLKPSATIFLDRMKKAWSQKKFRDKADKKSAFEILFSNKTKKQLRAYAEESNKDVISFLNMIIDEKLKEKRMEIIKADEE